MHVALSDVLCFVVLSSLQVAWQADLMHDICMRAFRLSVGFRVSVCSNGPNHAR